MDFKSFRDVIYEEQVKAEEEKQLALRKAAEKLQDSKNRFKWLIENIEKAFIDDPTVTGRRIFREYRDTGDIKIFKGDCCWILFSFYTSNADPAKDTLSFTEYKSLNPNVGVPIYHFNLESVNTLGGVFIQKDDIRTLREYLNRFVVIK